MRTPPPISRSFAAHLAALLLASLLTGCATFRSYNTELNQTLSIAASGRLDAAIKTLEKNNRKDDKDLLYYLEMGELQRLHTAYARSQTAWRTADFQVQAWEDAARADPARVSGAVLSYLVNDKVRPYEGHDYEKVMLTTRMAMNHLAEGRWDNARVAIKRTHEREAVIAEVRSREEHEVEEEARQRGAGVTFKDLNGYPVQTIDNPEVNGLRNSYQSAFSHYLAGFVYEALGEPSLAAAGYRQAIELRPSLPLLEDALAGLDWRVAAPDDGASDVLFVIETGLAPARVSRQFSLPIPIDERWVLVPVSFPVMQSHGAGFVPGELRVDGVEPLVPVRITSGAPQLIADNACAHYVVVAQATTADWRTLDLAAHPAIGRVEGRYEREGSGANVLGDPRVALAWLANELSGLGITLRRGQTVITGTCIKPLEILAGDVVTADLGVLGRATVRFA